MERLILLATALLFLLPASSEAQVQVSNQAGLASSIGLGESSYSSIFKNSVTVGNRLRFENGFVFSTANKLESNRGWFVLDRVGVMIFLDEKFFVDTGLDYRYRNGGPWVKQVVYANIGFGCELTNHRGTTQLLRGGFRKEIISINSLNDVSAAYVLMRHDQKFSQSTHWGLRMELEQGFLRYTQDTRRQSGFYSDLYVGVLYRSKF